VVPSPNTTVLVGSSGGPSQIRRVARVTVEAVPARFSKPKTTIWSICQGPASTVTSSAQRKPLTLPVWQ